MTDGEIRQVLHHAADGMTTPPDLLDRVRAGGRSRLLRRRALLGAGLAAAVAGAGGAAWRLGRVVEPVSVAAALFDNPTAGGLRDDELYLAQVRGAWTTVVPAGVRTVGDPHIVWAGTTSAGPVAAVSQRIERRASDTPGEYDYGLFGFAERGPAGPEFGEPQPVTTGVLTNFALLAGENRDVLVVVDPGLPVEWSPDYRYTVDGRVDRSFTRLELNADGAAVLDLQPQREHITVALRPAGDPAAKIGIFNGVDVLYGKVMRPGFGLPRPLRRDLPGLDRAWPGTPADRDRAVAEWSGDALAPWSDVYGTHRVTQAPLWSITGVTPDGSRFRVTTSYLDDDDSRILTLFGRPTLPPRVVFSGYVARNPTLAIHVRLPDGQGRVVAAEEATLRFRTPGGAWTRVEGDAALLPEGATEVEVTNPGAGPVVVPLT